MSVKIRLSRVGRRNFAQWRIAVYDTRTRRDGRCIENLGSYDPHQEKAEDKFKINMDRYKHWVANGAKPTEAIERLLKHTGSLAAK